MDGDREEVFTDNFDQEYFQPDEVMLEVESANSELDEPSTEELLDEAIAENVTLEVIHENGGSDEELTENLPTGAIVMEKVTIDVLPVVKSVLEHSVEGVEPLQLGIVSVSNNEAIEGTKAIAATIGQLPPGELRDINHSSPTIPVQVMVQEDDTEQKHKEGKIQKLWRRIMGKTSTLKFSKVE